jgi:hypothetical protein
MFDLDLVLSLVRAVAVFRRVRLRVLDAEIVVDDVDLLDWVSLRVAPLQRWKLRWFW